MFNYFDIIECASCQPVLLLVCSLPKVTDSALCTCTWTSDLEVDSRSFASPEDSVFITMPGSTVHPAVTLSPSPILADRVNDAIIVVCGANLCDSAIHGVAALLLQMTTRERLLEYTQVSAVPAKIVDAKTSVEESPMQAPLAQCKSSSLTSCCDFGVHCDCSQGSTASDQCEEASYAFWFGAGTLPLARDSMRT